MMRYNLKCRNYYLSAVRKRRRIETNVTAMVNAAAEPRQSTMSETDVVVIGSGIGGLCCAAMLGRYGYSVEICESHYLPGGAAHGFSVEDFEFDAGPSFFAGIHSDQSPSSNPLKQVLDAIEESVECVTYNKWTVYDPDGNVFPCVCSQQQYADMIAERGGSEALAQWRALEKLMAPLQKGAALFPAAALRGDLGVVLTGARMGPGLLSTAFMASTLTAPFSQLLDKAGVTIAWLRKFMDLECFVLSGMLAKDTICAEMAFMLMERNSGKSTIDYPYGGSKAIVDALLRGIRKYGGKLRLKTAVKQILIENARASGVITTGGKIIKARKAVVTNASVWDTAALLEGGGKIKQFQEQSLRTPQTGSFMHLHLGFKTEGLDLSNTECHHLFIHSFEDLEAPQNVCIASIPSVFDTSLAPPNHAVLHAYTAGNEPYELWEAFKPGNRDDYLKFKEERSEILWQSVEKIIPDIRDRTTLRLVGSPLTHARFLRRHKGTYGPAISAQNGSFPGPATDIGGLYRCGDSTMPGIGVPAAAASGLICANTLVPVWEHYRMLDSLHL